MTDSELNEAVAIKLGWEKTGSTMAATIPYEVWRRGKAETGGLRLYSSDISAAWEVVEFLRQKKRSTKGRFFDYGITIQTRANSRKFRVYVLGKVGIADTAPRAICQAFLKLPEKS